MKLNLTWFNRILASILTIGCLVITGCSIYIIIWNNTNRSPNVPIIYKPGVVEELDETNDADVLNMYKEHTRPIFVKEKGNDSGSLGTIWSYPISGNSERYYFATAIHVIASSLICDKDRQNIISINPKYEFYTTQNNSNINADVSFNTKLEDVRIVKTFLTNGYNDILKTSNPWNCSDFVILSSSTNSIKNIPNNNYLINSPEEFKQMLTSDEFYLCGFPFDEKDYKFRSVKYINNHTRDVYTTTMARYFGLDKYRKQTKAFKIVNTAGEETAYWSYTNMLLFENLYVGGGASGSLITTKINNQIKYVGILLGDISVNNWTKYRVYSDLFYTPMYNLTNDSIVKGYNNCLTSSPIQ